MPHLLPISCIHAGGVRGQKTISKENSLGELVEDQLTERHLSADERRVLEWHISKFVREWLEHLLELIRACAC